MENQDKLEGFLIFFLCLVFSFLIVACKKFLVMERCLSEGVESDMQMNCSKNVP